MPPRFMMGNLGGVSRLRTARVGSDVTDPTLDARYLTFDSAWTNSFRLAESGKVLTSSLSGSIFTAPAFGTIPFKRYQYKRLNINTAGRVVYTAWELPGGTRTLAGSSRAVVKEYRSRYCVLMGDHVRVYPRRPSDGSEDIDDGTLHWWAFEADPLAPEPGGPNGVFFGNHPTRGPGVYVSRPGFDPLTAGDSDLMLSSAKNNFQIYETGLSANTSFSSATGARSVIVTLANAYPDYPPVICFATEMRVTSSGVRMFNVNAYWISPTQIAFDARSTSTENNFQVRFAIISSDASYNGGADTVSTMRCYASPATGFGITKKNISALTAAYNEWLFRSDRMSFYFNGFKNVALGASPSLIDFPVAAPSGAPFSFFLLSDFGNTSLVGTLCGIGGVSSQHWEGETAVGSGILETIERYVLCTRSATQFQWWQAGAFPSGAFGKVASVNVCDF